MNNDQISPATTGASLDEELQALGGKILQDIAGAFAVLLGYMGDQAGVYAALRDLGPSPCEKLAEVAGVDARYLREWLSAQAAAGYVTYHEEGELFSLSEAQAIVLAKEGDPAFLQGFFQVITAQFTTHEKAIEIFRSGEGRPWGDHHSCCFCGTDRFFRPGYTANLVNSWLPSLSGVVEKLEQGAKVADVGCGHGSSTTLMAQAYPNSMFTGYDFHAPSIDAAIAKAAENGVVDNTRFEVAAAKNLTAREFDLICMFDALHDMGDPVGAAKGMLAALAEDGALMLVEPLAGDSLSDNLHPLGQIFYSASTLVCTPTSRAQEVGLALGAQAGFKRLEAVLREAGFSRVRLATTGDTNMVIEARP